MRLGIVGSRKIKDKKEVWDIIYNYIRDNHTKWKDKYVIVSGGAKGVDTIAKDYATAALVDYIEFLPYFKVNLKAEYDPVHYLARNAQIVDNSDQILAITTKESKGTIHTINYARSKNVPVEVVRL